MLYVLFVTFQYEENFVQTNEDYEKLKSGNSKIMNHSQKAYTIIQPTMVYFFQWGRDKCVKWGPIYIEKYC